MLQLLLSLSSSSLSSLALDISQLHPGAKISLSAHKQSFNNEAKSFLDDMWKQTMEPLGYDNYDTFADAIRERNRNLFGEH